MPVSHGRHLFYSMLTKCDAKTEKYREPVNLKNLNLNLMRQRIQVIQLTITGKKAIAYICPLLSLRWRSNFRLKPANEHPEIISSSKIFREHRNTGLVLFSVSGSLKCRI